MFEDLFLSIFFLFIGIAFVLYLRQPKYSPVPEPPKQWSDPEEFGKILDNYIKVLQDMQNEIRKEDHGKT